MRSNEEHHIQSAICQYLDAMKYYYFAIPNGGNRDAATGSILKKEGVKAGAADLCILIPGSPVFVEVKTSKGYQQKSQKAFQEKVESLGFKYFIWRSVDDAVSFVKSIGNKL